MQKLVNVFLVPDENESAYLAEIEFDSKIRNIELKKKYSAFPDKLIHAMKGLKARAADPQFPGVLDGKFNLLIPGGIDPHVHFDEPGFTFREDFYSGTLSAAFGGITTVIDMPCTSKPPVTNSRNLLEKLAAVNKNAAIDFAFWGGVSGTEFEEKADVEKSMSELAEAGVVGFKTYLISGMEKFTELSTEKLKIVGKIARKLELPVAVHSEDKDLVRNRRKKLRQKSKNEFSDYCKARDVKAEITAIQEVINIAQETNTYFHVVHLSSKRGLELIHKAQQKGIKVTTETCPHFLAFTQSDYTEIGSVLKTAPPVKKAEDREALWKGLKEGIIDFVATDHAGCIPEKEKFTGNIWTDYAGIPGTELMIPYIFSRGYITNKLSLKRTIEITSENAAKYYNLYPEKGSLKPGTDADFALLDLTKLYKVKADNLHCKGKYTPFANREFHAKIMQTFAKGKLLIDNEKFLGKRGSGNFIKARNE